MKPRRAGHPFGQSRITPASWLLFWFAAFGVSAAADTPQERYAEKIAWELGSWKAIDYHVVSTLRNYAATSARPQVFDTIDTHYVETALGQRKQQRDDLMGESLIRREKAYFDGKRGANVVFGGPEFGTMKQVEILRHYPRIGKTRFSNRPTPFGYYYLGFEPLNQALPRSRHLGEEVVMGRPSDAFLFTQDKTETIRDLVTVLDRETGVPLEVRGYRTPDDLKAGRPAYAWKASSLKTFQGHPVVNSSRLERYTEADSSINYTSDFNVQSVEFDKDHAASEFFPAIPPGTEVMDTIAGKIVIWPGASGKTKSRPTPAPIATPASDPAASPIRAELPRNGISPSLVLGGISVALLAAGAVLWRRNA